MATGARISIFPTDGSDMVYNYTCSPCEDNNLNSEAAYYCQHCQKQYCQVCEHLHKKLFKGHLVMDSQHVAKWGTVKRQDSLSDPLEMCVIHMDEKLKMFCADHSKLCCTICVSVNHRSCKEVKHLPDVARDCRTQPDFINLLNKSEKVNVKLTEMVETRKNNTLKLQDTRNKIIAEIDEQQRKINERFEEIKERTVKELDEILAKFHSKIDQDVEKCSKILAEMNKLLLYIQDDNKRTETATYIGFQKCKGKMTEAVNLLTGMFKQDYQVTFQEDLQIEMNISEMEKYGEFQTVPEFLRQTSKTSEHKVLPMFLLKSGGNGALFMDLGVSRKGSGGMLPPKKK